LLDSSTWNSRTKSLETEEERLYDRPGSTKPSKDTHFTVGRECLKLGSYCQTLVDRIPKLKRGDLEIEAAAGGYIFPTCESFPYFESEVTLESSAAGRCSLCSCFTEAKKEKGNHTYTLKLQTPPASLNNPLSFTSALIATTLRSTA